MGINARTVMFMIAAERESPPSTARAAEARSPFARLNDLLSPIAPGKPPINCAVGEPQHPIPVFVGPVLAAHLADFGRYPANKGTENFRRAVAQWLSRRYGGYAAFTDSAGQNPGADYRRIAMVHDNATTAEALHRLVAVLG